MADHAPWPNPPPVKPHFLQHLLRDFKSNLHIPIDFCQYLNGSKSGKFKLRSRMRKRPWMVEIVERRMVDGWDEFVKDHELKVGDYLVFRYDGDMVFDVTVFDPNTCERMLTMLDDDDDDGNLVETAIVAVPELVPIRMRTYYGSSLAEADSYMGTMRPSYLKSLYFPMSFILANKLTECTGIIVRDERGKLWPVKLSVKKLSNVVHTADGWKSFVKGNDIRVGENFEIQIISKGSEPVLSFRRVTMEVNYMQSELVKRLEIEQVSTATELHKSVEEDDDNDGGGNEDDLAEEGDASLVESAIVEVLEIDPIGRGYYYDLSQAETESYVGTVWPSHIRNLYFPISFTLANKLNECSGIVLKDEGGKLWPVKLAFNKNRNNVAYTTDDWKIFINENGIRVGENFEVQEWEANRFSGFAVSADYMFFLSNKVLCFGFGQRTTMEENSINSDLAVKQKVKQVSTGVVQEVSGNLEETNGNLLKTEVEVEQESMMEDVDGKMEETNGNLIETEVENQLCELNHNKTRNCSGTSSQESNRNLMKPGAENQLYKFDQSKRRSYHSSQVRTDSYVGTMGPTYMKKLFFPIPFSAANQLNKASLGIVVRDEGGKSWPVTLGFKKCGKVVYTGDGWRSLIEASGIREGEDFEVRVISPGSEPVLSFRRLSASKKAEKPELASRLKDEQMCDLTKSLKATEVLKPTGNCTYITKTLSWASIRHSRLFVGKEFARSNNLINKCGKMILKNQDGVAWEALLKYEGEIRDHFYIGAGWKEFALSNGLGDGSVFKLEIEDPESKVLSLKLSEVSTEGKAAIQLPEPITEAVPKPAKRQRFEEVPDSADGQKAMDQTQTKKPCKWKTGSSSAGPCKYFYRPSTLASIERSRLYIPIEVAVTNDLINKCGEIVLKNPNGESWKASLHYDCKRHDQFYIGAGWREFALSNSLEVGCVFKFEFEDSESNSLILKLSEICMEEKAVNSETIKRQRAEQLPQPAIEELPEPATEITPKLVKGDHFEEVFESAEGQKPMDQTPVKKEIKRKTSSSSAGPCKYVCRTLTLPSIERSRMYIPIEVAVSNDLIHKCGEIVLKNLNGESWIALLNYDGKSGRFYIGSGWKEFALSNGLGVGCDFKLEIEEPETEVLTFKLSGSSIAKKGQKLELFERLNVEQKLELAKRQKISEARERTGHCTYFTRTLRLASIKNSRLFVSKEFARSNNLINKCGIMILKNQSGEFWEASLKYEGELRHRFYIGAGWKEFALSNSLGVGCIFTLEIEDPEKDVLILKLSRASTEEKAADQLPENATEEVPDEDMPEYGEEQKAPDQTPIKKRLKQRTSSSSAGSCTYFNRTSTSSSIERSRMYIPKEVAEFNDLINKCGEIVLRNLNGESWKAKLHMDRKNNDKFYIGSGWKQFALSNGLGVGCGFKLEIEDTENELLILKLSGVNMEEKAAEQLTPTNEVVPKLPKRRHFKEASESADEQKALNQTPTNKQCKLNSGSLTASPCKYFYRTLTLPSIERSRMYIPLEVALSNDLINKCGEMVLKNLNGESWKAMLNYEEPDHFYIGSGWTQFAFRNGLVIGCDFKLEIEDSQSKVLTLKLTDSILIKLENDA